MGVSASRPDLLVMPKLRGWLVTSGCRPLPGRARGDQHGTRRRVLQQHRTPARQTPKEAWT